MSSRRKFLKLTALSSLLPAFGFASKEEKKEIIRSKKPIVISTWKHGMEANLEALKVLRMGNSSLDAVGLTRNGIKSIDVMALLHNIFEADFLEMYSF